MSSVELKWMEETVEDVPSNKWLYKLLCFCIGRRKEKITYKELYIFYTNVYSKNEDYKKKAINTILNIYEYNNGRLPE